MRAARRSALLERNVPKLSDHEALRKMIERANRDGLSINHPLRVAIAELACHADDTLVRRRAAARMRAELAYEDYTGKKL